jgi:hypothetical protein
VCLLTQKISPRASLGRNDGYGVVRRPSRSVNLLQKTLSSLLRNATFPLVGKVELRLKAFRNAALCA